MVASGGQQQSLIGLLGVRLLRVQPHKNLAVEHAPRPPVQNALVHFMAVAVGHGVVYGRVVVYQLPVAPDVQAVQRTLDAFAAQSRIEVVAHDQAAERDAVRGEVRAALQLDLRGRDVIGRSRLVVQLVMVDVRRCRRHRCPSPRS